MIRSSEPVRPPAEAHHAHSNVDDAEPRTPDGYFALDHIILRTYVDRSRYARTSRPARRPSVKESLALAKQYGFVAHGGGSHADGVTENVLISLADGVYLELISFVEPPPNEQARKSHWWNDKNDGLIDWACAGQDQEKHLQQMGGEEAYNPPKEGGRMTKEGKEIKWRVTFPATEPRGRLPFMCDDLTPREWRVPEPQQHANGAIAIKSITLLSKPTRMSRLYNPLVTVLGRMSEEPMGTSSDKGAPEFPPRRRKLRLSSPKEPKRARIDVFVRDAETDQVRSSF